MANFRQTSPMGCKSPLTAIACDIDTNLGCTACQELSSLENRISETRLLLASLLDRKNRHFTALNTTHDKLTRRLPIELCSRIFQFSTIRGPFKRATPFLLSRISKGWRSIALATPQIWPSQNIVLNSKKPIEEGVRIISDILSRSRNLPLCITLDPKIDYTRPVPDARMFNPILDVIRGQATRWKSLEIMGQYEVANYLLFNCPDTALLNRLHINSDYWPDYWCTKSLPSAENFPSAPLVSVHGWEFDNIPVHWERVTEFWGDNHSFNTVLEIIRHSPSLESCKDIIRRNGGDIDISSSPGAVNTRLKDLNLTFSDQREPGEDESDEEVELLTLFSKLTLPGLERLRLCVLNGSDVILNGIDDFLQRSSCSLTRLSLVMSSSGLDTPIVDLLYLTPCLKELEIRDDDRTFIMDFFGDLASTASSVSTDPSNTRLLPALEIIEVHILDDAEWIKEEDIISLFPPEADASGSMMQYRPLKKLFVWRRPVRGNADYKILAMDTVNAVLSLRQRGFDIVLKYYASRSDPDQRYDLVEYSRQWHAKTAAKSIPLRKE